MYPVVLVLVNLHQRRERMRLAPRHLTTDQRRTAERASLRGPVPLDPEVRAEALRLNRLVGARAGSGGIVLKVVLVLAGAGGLLAGFLVEEDALSAPSPSGSR